MGERESAGDNQIRASSKERMTSQCRPARWALTPAISFRCWLWILFLSLRRLPDSPAQRIHCLNNVKQLALGSFMYASDNSRHAGVEAPAFPGGNWMGTLNEYAKVKGILICPSAPLHHPPPVSGNEQGYADRAWVRGTSRTHTPSPRATYTHHVEGLDFVTGSAWLSYDPSLEKTYRVVTVYRPVGLHGPGFTSQETNLEISK